MRFASKLVLSLTLLSCATITAYSQADSVCIRYKQLQNRFNGRVSAYDTMAVYFNKWKVNFTGNIGIGLDNGVFTGSGNSPSLYGAQNPAYSINFSPAYSFSSFYGFTEKSAVGLGVNYRQVTFVPRSTSQPLSQGSASEFTITAGYLHCIRSWRYFYYGFELGAMFLNTNFDTNAYSDKPKNKVSPVQPVFKELIGFRYPIETYLWLHIEVSSLGLINTGASTFTESIGLDYAVDTRPLCHKPVKMDPYFSLENVHKRYVKDSTMKSKPKYKELHDTNSIYYNKDKLHYSVEIGPNSLEATVGAYLGFLSPEYNVVEEPLFRAAVDYGLGVKSNVGISLMFMQVNYEKSNPSSYYTNGNITYLALNARYTHTLFGSKNFYYGAEIGMYSLGFNYNKSNTFYDPPQLVYLAGSGIGFGPLIGVKVAFTKSLSLHTEIVFTESFFYSDFGITYTINSPVRLRK